MPFTLTSGGHFLTLGRMTGNLFRRRLGLGLVSLLPLALIGCGSTRPPVSTPARTPSATPVPMLGDNGMEVVLQAMVQVGTPYRWGGNTPDEGFDCSGLVVHVYQEAIGLRLPRTSRALGQTGIPVRPDRLHEGDLVFFNTLGRRNSHVGIYAGDGRFIHAPSSGAKVRLEPMANRYWSRRFDGARRIIGSPAAASAAQRPT